MVSRASRRAVRWVAALLVAMGSAWAAAAADGADWPDWRGPGRDGLSPEPLPAAFPDEPRPLWRRPVGRGYYGPVVAGDSVVVVDLQDDRETALCLDRATGEVRWRTPYAVAWSDEFEPGPRCTPVVHDGRVYVQSARGEFACLDLATGRRAWGFDFAGYGTEWIDDRQGGIGAATRRGHTGSPVIDGDRIIVQVGSARGACLVAFDRRTGRELWRSLDDLTAYTSPVVGELAGRRQVVTATCEGLVGVSSVDGALLWRVPFRTRANRNVLTPLLDGDTVTFASFTTGMRRVRVRAEGDGWAAGPEWVNPALNINLSTPVRVADHLYGLGPARDYVCVDRRDGAIRWRQTGFGEVASTIASGDRLLVQTDVGEVLLVRADPGAYVELGRFQACGKTFSHPAWAGGILFVRDPREVVAWVLKP